MAKISLKCLLGFHQYGKRYGKQYGNDVHLCVKCKLSGYFKYPSPVNFEYWKDFDTYGNTVHYKNSNGYEYWREYDERGNSIHSKDSDGDEWWCENDERDNVIHYKNSDGYERWKDNKGNWVANKQENK